MSTTDEGGPAFPHLTLEECRDGVTAVTDPKCPGMTLRDYFAAKAMAAFAISEVMEAFRRNDYDGQQNHNVYVPSTGFNDLAKIAYQQADAMLAQRNRE